MRFPKECKLHRATGARGRYRMDCVWHDAGQMVATDGHIVAIIAVTDDDDDSPAVLLPKGLVKAATQGKGTATVTANGHATAAGPDGQIRAELEEGEFPRYASVLPDVPDVRRVRVGLNARYLANLASALGDDVVALEFDMEELDPAKSYRRPIRVRSAHGTGAIMPCMVDSE